MDRIKLVAHVREQLRADPEAYANQAKLRIVTGKLVELLGGVDDEDGDSVLDL